MLQRVSYKQFWMYIHSSVYMVFYLMYYNKRGVRGRWNEGMITSWVEREKEVEVGVYN